MACSICNHPFVSTIDKLMIENMSIPNILKYINAQVDEARLQNEEIDHITSKPLYTHKRKKHYAFTILDPINIDEDTDLIRIQEDSSETHIRASYAIVRKEMDSFRSKILPGLNVISDWELMANHLNYTTGMDEVTTQDKMEILERIILRKILLMQGRMVTKPNPDGTFGVTVPSDELELYKILAKIIIDNDKIKHKMTMLGVVDEESNEAMIKKVIEQMHHLPSDYREKLEKYFADGGGKSIIPGSD